MLTIDRMSIELPAGFEQRASGLADLIGAHLAALDCPTSISIGHMRVEHALPLTGASDQAIAGAVASSVARQVRERR